MGSERLSGRAIMRAHRDVPNDIDQVIAIFQAA